MDKMARLNVLLGASVVTMGPQNRIPVTVMNNSEVPVKLFAGTRIGELSPVKVEEQSPEVNTIPGGPPPPPTTPKKGPAAVDLRSNSFRETGAQTSSGRANDVFANDDSEVGRTHRA